MLVCVVAALVPGFVLVGYIQANHRAQLLADARQSAGVQAQLVLADQQDVTRTARQVLGVVAVMPQVQSLAEQCSATLATALAAAGEFVQFGVAGLDGMSPCNALPHAVPVYAGDRSWFRKTVATGEFAVGDYQVGRITRRPTVNFGYPVRNAGGDMVGVVFAAVDLERLIPEDLGIPSGGEVLVLDADGVVLASAAAPQRVGRPAGGSELVGLLRAAIGGGVLVGPGLDGVERQWVVASLGPSSQGALVAVGMSTSMVTAEADRIRDQGLALLLSTLVIVGAGVWLLSDVVAVGPLRKLLAAAARLRAGDLSARTGLRAAGEIGELARGFDEMAGALDARDRRLRDQAELLDLAATMIYVCDPQGRITHWNAAAEHRYGWTAGEAVGRTVDELLATEFPGPRDEIMAELRRDGRWEGEVRHRRRDGTPMVVASSYGLRRDGDGQMAAVLVVDRDLSERTALEERLVYEATHDPLTGMPNRRAFLDHLHRALADARGTARSVNVLVCGIDHFKILNDSLGHEAGDDALVVVGERLALAGGHHPVYRFGGDVFAVLHEGPEPQALADLLLEAARAPTGVYGREFFLTLSIGIATSIGGDLVADQLLRQADIAMYQAKATGKDRAERFEPRMLDGLLERVELEAELRHGIEQGELVLHYQPKIDLRSGALVGAEALVRWQHPTRGLVPPDEFIPLAEDTGLILSLGRWALQEATRQTRQWQQRSGRDLTIAVNVSTRQLRDPGLERDVEAALDSSGLPPAGLTIEITESALQEGTSAATVLSRLDQLGVRLSIDDFGTGYSSLDRLRHIPVHEVKIDKAFVQEIDATGDGAPLVVAMIAMAHSLGHHVVAEGVESPHQIEFLRAHGCDQAQGYLVGRPVPGHEFERWFDHQPGYRLTDR